MQTHGHEADEATTLSALVARFGAPFVDEDEWRAEPLAHRYVHGGFADSAVRFSLYFPEPSSYDGRFFQHVTPVPQSERLAQQAVGEESRIELAVTSGAYFVETNGGGRDANADPRVGAYLANAAAAQYSRIIAEQMYGPHRAFGYLYGGSGGAYRTVGAAENTRGVWDGFVPYVVGSTMAAPNVFTARVHALRVLGDALDDVVDVNDVGGDPESLDLTDEQREALDEVTRLGFPQRAWFGWRELGLHGFRALYPGILAADPTYTDDFWREPGYLGADAQSSVHRDRIVHDAVVRWVGATEQERTTLPAGGVDESFRRSAERAVGVDVLRVEPAPPSWALGIELRVTSGRSSGAVLRVQHVDDATVALEAGQPSVDIAVGDAVTLDNSRYLAMQTYHRHQVPPTDYPMYDAYRDEHGAPVPPQRRLLLGPMFAAAAAGSVPCGRFAGRMIVVASLLDREAYPWQADWYRTQAAAHGNGDDQLRLWFVDNATHSDAEHQADETCAVSYLGVLHVALRRLAAWVEGDADPGASTAYAITDAQVAVPAAADERHGLQQSVDVTVDGARSVTVRTGEPVRVTVRSMTPSAGLPITAIAWDVDGSGRLNAPVQIESTRSLEQTVSVTYDSPGVRFITCRVTAQEGADAGTSIGRVHNLGRARVTVL